MLTSICRGHEWIRFRLAIITESTNRNNEQDCQVLDPIVFLDFSYYFMHLFSSHVLGVSNCVSMLKRQNGDGQVRLAGQSTNWHPYQIGEISLLAINCSLILMEDKNH